MERKKALIALQEQESRFPASAGAYAAMLAENVRLYRGDNMPFVGIQAAGSALAARPGAFEWSVQGAAVSAAGDLGYAYGRVKFTPAGGATGPEEINFVRIWKKQRNGAWKVVLDLLS